MSQLDVFRVIARRRWVALAVFLITVSAAGVFAVTKAKTYDSTATVALFPRPLGNGNIISADSLGALITTYAKTVQSGTTLAQARALNHGSLPGSVKTSTQAGSDVLQIIGHASSARGALLTARAASTAFLAEQANNPVVSLQLIGPPSVSRAPTQPRPPLIVGLGAILGLFTAGFMALLFDRIWKHVETAEDLAEITDAPVIGRIPRKLHPSEESGAGDGRLPQALQESIRVLRANLKALTRDRGGVILVTSATSVQGKSTIVASLGIALAQAGTSTVIVDADLRKPQQHDLFDVDHPSGLSSLLHHHLNGYSANGDPLTGELHKALLASDFDGLSLLPAGPLDPSSPELLPMHFPAIIEGVRNLGHLVLVDGPPLLAVSDARVLATQCDSVLLVTAAGKETPRAVATAIDRLTLLQCDLMGIVLNRVRAGSGDDVDYGYYG
jgi:succinoglycan biosynthesis transport protein ExoP